MEDFPMPSTSKSCDTSESPKKRLKLDSNSGKEIILNVYNFIKNLKSDPATWQTVEDKTPQELTAIACGISIGTVKRISSTMKDGGPSPRKKYPKRNKPLTEIDTFDQDIVRRTVLEHYDKGEYPTIDKVKAALVEKIDYKGSRCSVWRIVKNLGFKYKKSKDGRKFILERNDIVAKRNQFLRKMNDIRSADDGRKIYYLDETWVNQNHSKHETWLSDKNEGGLKVPTGKGGRLIICHVGSSEGFVREAKLIFRSRQKPLLEDYHTEMNAEIFKEWFTNFLGMLEEPSVIVMDNAPYHSVQINKAPCSNSAKQEIIEWLTNQNINFDRHQTRAELLEVVKQHKEIVKKIYEIDQIAIERGHEVVRLPPYHCQYNPIELIWAQVKAEVAKKNKTFKMDDVKKLVDQAIDNITADKWKKCVEHAEKLQENDFAEMENRDYPIHQLVINLNESSESTDYFSDSESD